MLTNAQGAIQGANLNKVVDITKDAGNQLVATQSDLIPSNSFTAGIEAANQRIKSVAASDAAKAAQEESGKTQAFFGGAGALSSVKAFTTGTNKVVQSGSALGTTPYKDSQINASPQVANNLTSSYFTQPSAASYQGKTSTNPAPPQQVII